MVGEELALRKTRVIGIYAHIDAGKTTTSEAMLYLTGRIHRAGSVDEGNTQLDWMEQERARGITITAAATTCLWRGHRINLIDTPGHIDFSAEVVRSIRVIDGAVVVLCGVGGVETQTETVWMHADRQSLPRLIFVNKLDRSVADFVGVVADVRERLTTRAVPIHLPLYEKERLGGLVDLLEQRALVWRKEEGSPGDDRGEEPVVGPIPPSMQAKVGAWRAELIDAICETDDALLLRRVEGQDLEPAVLRAALRAATIHGRLVPVCCGSAKDRIGVQPLLDAVVDYLPAPVDLPPRVGSWPEEPGGPVACSPDPGAPFCASAFKISTDPHVGHLTWVRIFSGRLQVGESVYNPRTDTQERVGRIYLMHANRREHMGRAQVGDVVALVGVPSAITGDTLCNPAIRVVLEPFRFPQPVIGVALTPLAEDERDRLYHGVVRLCEEDPTLSFTFDPQTGEQILSGMGELHLEIAVDRLRSEFGIVAQVSRPQVAYRETVWSRAEATGTYRRQTGGHGHFAVVRLRVEPAPRGMGVMFESVAPISELTQQFVRAAQAGAQEALDKGIIAGYPVTDIRVIVLGGKYHEVDSDSRDFQIAGSMAVRQAVRRANPALLEPIMRADIRVESEYLGTLLADIGRRRGAVAEVRGRNSIQTVVGEVPLAEMRGYVTALRDFTHGRGTFTLEFLRHDLVPESLAEGIIAQRRAEGRIPLR
jgi:elongation factor G